MEPSGKKVTLTAMFGDMRVALEQALLRRPRAWLADARVRMENLPKTNFDLGVRFAGEGKLFDAVFRFRIVLLLDKNYPNTWYNLGSCYFRMGRLKEAADTLGEAYRRDPANLQAKFMLASVAPEMIASNERPTTMPQEMVVPFFSAVAAEYDVTEAASGYQAGAVVHDLVKPLLSLASPEVLDLGCGTGIASRPWRAEASRITGVDITPAMITVADAATQGDRKLFDRLVEADLASLPDDLRADLVLAINLAQFVGDIRPLMRSVAQVLNPQGVMVLTLEPYAGKNGFGLTAETGRFGHNPSYVKEAAQAAGLLLAKEETLALYPNQPQQTLVFRKA